MRVLPSTRSAWEGVDCLFLFFAVVSHSKLRGQALDNSLYLGRHKYMTFQLVLFERLAKPQRKIGERPIYTGT